MQPKNIKCTVPGCGGETTPQNRTVLLNGDLGKTASAVACGRCLALYWITDGFGVVVRGTSDRVYLVDGKPATKSAPAKKMEHVQKLATS